MIKNRKIPNLTLTFPKTIHEENPERNEDFPPTNGEIFGNRWDFRICCRSFFQCAKQP